MELSDTPVATEIIASENTDWTVRTQLIRAPVSQSVVCTLDKYADSRSEFAAFGLLSLIPLPFTGVGSACGRHDA